MSAVCQERGPKPGDVIGALCACGHVNVVHDAGGCAVCALRVIAPASDPQPPTLREQVAQAWCAEFYGEFSRSAQQPAPDQLDAADAVLAVVADWLAEQPHTTDSWAEMYGEQKAQRDHDVRLLRGES